MNDWTVSDAYSEQRCDLIALELGTTLYDTLSEKTPFARQIQDVRKQIMSSHGLYIPAIRIKRIQNTDVPDAENRYTIRVRGGRVGEGCLHPPLNFSTAAENGIRAVHPLSHQPGFWHEGDGVSAEQLLLKHVLTVMQKKAAELLTYETAARWLQQAKSHAPELTKELERRGMTPGLLWQVMRKLLTKGVPLHPFEDLLEVVMEYYIVHPPHGYAPSEWSHPHPDDMAKYIAEQKKKRLPPREHSKAVVHKLKR